MDANTNRHRRHRRTTFKDDVDEKKKNEEENVFLNAEVEREKEMMERKKEEDKRITEDEKGEGKGVRGSEGGVAGEAKGGTVCGEEEEEEEGDLDRCLRLVFDSKRVPKHSSRMKMAAMWTRPRVNTFPCIREPEVAQETPDQRALRRLRSRLCPFVEHPCYHYAVGLSDEELLAWLTTFDLNVYMVEAKLKRHCETRKALGLDTILTDYTASDVLDHHYTGGLCGADRQGRPIWYELLGKLDMNSLVKSVVRDDLIRHKFYQLELIKKMTSAPGFTQILVMVDMKGMPIKVLGPALEIWRKYIDIIQDHYPHLVHEFIIIHPPGIFTEFTLGLRPYLNRTTRSKVTVLGTNYFKYLKERVEMHQIPAFLGGYKCDIDNNPWCRENLSWNGVVPRWMFSYPHMAAHVHRLTIPGGQRLVIETHVATPGSHVYWVFYRINQPIMLSAYLNGMSEEACVVKEHSVSPASTSTGHLTGVISQGAGRYLTVLDNCKTFNSPAKGLYKIEVQPPEWLEAKLAENKPLGHSFDMSRRIGEDERKWRHRMYLKKPQPAWKHELPPIERM